MSACSSLAAVGATFLVAFAVGASPEQSQCLRALEEGTARTESTLARFERSGGADVTAAREVLAAATAGRDRLEAQKVSAFCERSRAEELIYLNHLTLGFAGWIAARSRRPPVDYELASIIRRARVHLERGRAQLR